MSDADIFHGASGGLDVSDAALSERWEEYSAVPEADAEELVEGDADGTADADEDAEEGDEVVREDEEGADEQLPPEPDPEDSAARRELEEAQREIGRQATEVGDLRQQVAQLNEQLQFYAMQMMQPQIDPSAFDDVDPVGAYPQAIDLLDQGVITPDIVDGLIDRAYEEGRTRDARQMERDFMYRMSRAELRREMMEREERHKSEVEPLRQSESRRAIKAATDGLYADPVLGEDARAYEAEVVALIKEPKTKEERAAAETFAEDPAKGLRAALEIARGRDVTKSKAYREAIAELKRNSQVEGGSAPDEREPEKTFEDKIRESVFGKPKHEQGISRLGL